MVTRFKEFIQEGAKEDLIITKASISIIHGISNLLKRTMTPSVLKELERDTVYYVRKGVHEIAKITIDEDEDTGEKYFVVLIALERFFKDYLTAPLDPPLRIEFLRADNPYNYGSFTPFKFANKINIFIDPKYMLVTKKNFAEFHKTILNGKPYTTMSHEFSHYLDSLRAKGKLPTIAQASKDYKAYYNDLQEINARYFEATMSILWFIKRLLSVQTSINDFYRDAKDFVADLLKYIPNSEYLDTKNKQRIIRRAYKLYDELKSMKPDEFAKFKSQGISKRWVESHIKRVYKL